MKKNIKKQRIKFTNFIFSSIIKIWVASSDGRASAS